MTEIDRVFMLVRIRRKRPELLYHRPGTTAREAWDYALKEGLGNEESLRADGWRAKRVVISGDIT